MKPGKIKQLLRLIELLHPFLKENDCDFSDPDFIYHLGKRYQKAWQAQQALVDPSE